MSLTPSQAPALLPCPCCGGLQTDRRARSEIRATPILEELDDWDGGGWRVSCLLCGMNTGLGKSLADAGLTWNRRPA